MKDFFKLLIKQYFICKHLEYIVLREIYCGKQSGGNYPGGYPVFMEKRKCKECGREFYSDYYSIFKKKRFYFKDFNRR